MRLVPLLQLIFVMGVVVEVDVVDGVVKETLEEVDLEEEVLV